MKKYILIAIIVIILLLIGLFLFIYNNDGHRFAREYNSLNNQTNESGQEYLSLDINTDNNIV